MKRDKTLKALNIDKLKETIAEMVFENLREKCLPLIENYRDDLLRHDRNTITGCPCIPFIHITRRLGTHMALMFPPDHESWPGEDESQRHLFGFATREEILDDRMALIRHTEREKNSLRIFHFDGSRLREITLFEAGRTMEDYIKKTKEEWRDGRRKTSGINEKIF